VFLGYTAWTELHGAEAAAGLIETFTDLAYESLQGDSRILERIGDQIVIIAPDPDDIVKTAIRLYEKVTEEYHFLPVHTGIHYGGVFKHNDHLFSALS